MKTIFLVNAYRVSGEHSYVVGIFEKKFPAIKAADQECSGRGGKYSCYVYELEINKIIEYAKDEAVYVVKGRQ